MRILPSFIAMIVGVFFLVAAILLFFTNLKKINTKDIIIILILISIAISLHAILHFLNEVYYNFNPIQKLLDL
jgi:asparagine N-glycosylation enzyme membrane subunit Stt3